MAAGFESKDFVIGPFTFKLGTNSFREDRGRQVLDRLKVQYIGQGTFASELERMSAVEAFDPFYTDIIGACKAIDGDPQHPDLKGFQAFPKKWDDFYWDELAAGHYEQFVQAAVYTQSLHPHWYPQPQVPAESTPEADATIQQTLAALDPSSTSDVEPPDTSEIMEAVQSRADAAGDARSDDFLGR